MVKIEQKYMYSNVYTLKIYYNLLIIINMFYIVINFKQEKLFVWKHYIWYKHCGLDLKNTRDVKQNLKFYF